MCIVDIHTQRQCHENIKKNRPEDLDLEENVKKAIAAVKEDGVSVRAASKLHGVGRMTLQSRLSEGAKPIKSVGGQLSLPKEAEMELAECLKIKARWGFGNTTKEVKHLVKSFVDSNITQETPTGAYLRKYCKFKSDNLPGEDWCTSFMRRYRLSCKLPSSLEKTRKSAASDPEIIYEYFDNVNSEIMKLKNPK